MEKELIEAVRYICPKCDGEGNKKNMEWREYQEDLENPESLLSKATKLLGEGK